MGRGKRERSGRKKNVEDQSRPHQQAEPGIMRMFQQQGYLISNSPFDFVKIVVKCHVKCHDNVTSFSTYGLSLKSWPYVQGCPGELKERGLCPCGGDDVLKGQCVQEKRREEIKKGFTGNRNLELETKQRAVYNSWRYGETPGFPRRRGRLKSLYGATNWKCGPRTLNSNRQTASGLQVSKVVLFSAESTNNPGEEGKGKDRAGRRAQKTRSFFSSPIISRVRR